MVSKKKILIVGGDSTLGKNFSFFLKKKKTKFIKTTRRKKNKYYLDLLEINKFNIPKDVKSAVIFAYQNNIAYCEKNYKQAYEINVQNIYKLVKKLLLKKIFILFISTNLVFDNSKLKRYEKTSKKPITNYGKMKSICEDKITNFAKINKLNEYFSILRISKVLNFKYNPIKLWADHLKKKKVIFIPDDIFCCPIDINSLNNSIFKIIKNSYSGIFHLSGEKEFNYYQLAKKIFNKSKYLKYFKAISSKNLLKPIYNSNVKTFLSLGRNSQKIGIRKISISKIKKEIKYHD